VAAPAGCCHHGPISALVRPDPAAYMWTWYEYLLVFTKFLLIFVGVGLFVSGLDDLFLDFAYWIRRFWRSIFVLRRYPKLTYQRLAANPQQAVAILVPAWQEADVIARMAENTVTTVDYTNFHIFIGTYRNDEATGLEVERVRQLFPNVHRVVVPEDGPTCKADCLNWVIQGVDLYERERGLRFEIFVMQDAEDIVHPLSLLLYNHLIPKRDMVQIPVYSLPMPWHKWVAGTYIDEFAEFHTKNLVVRESLAEVVPSAGVGTAFGRRALDRLREAHKGLIFNVDSLTEDYEFGMKLGQYGLQGIFVNQRIEYPVETKEGVTWHDDPIATREYFPSTFRAAYRQKSRWTLGIALQGWAHLGWRGTQGLKYIYYQDRKGLISNQLGFLSYLLLLLLFFIQGVAAWMGDDYPYPSLVQQDTWLWYVLVADTIFMIWRLFSRALFVKKIYGWKHAILSVPRQVVGNAVNYAATCRAIRQYVGYLITGNPIAWEKTAHVYPSLAAFESHHRRLGDLLLAKKLITVDQLQAGLEQQRSSGGRLGEVLLRRGAVSERQMTAVLGEQLRMAVCDIDAGAIPAELLMAVPRKVAAQCGAIPSRVREGKVVIAVSALSSVPLASDMEKQLRRPISMEMASPSDVSYALRFAYDGAAGDAREREDAELGEKLVAMGAADKDQIIAARQIQKATYRPLGEVLVEMGVFGRNQLAEHLESYYNSTAQRFGEFLTGASVISPQQLEAALESQRALSPRLGEVLVQAKSATDSQIALAKRAAQG
jgi:bacteriophage N4 adsorption protein B